MRVSPVRLLPLALLLAAAPSAAIEPPPIPAKDLSFGDGWSFQSRGNNCTATRALGPGVTLRLGFTNFEDGVVSLLGKGLPPIPEERMDALTAQHRKGSTVEEDAEGYPVDRFESGVTYANFPGTALFVDGAIAGRFDFGLTEGGATTYRLGTLQSAIWSKVKAGKDMRIKILGKEAAAIQLSAATGLWDEMQKCIDQYPDG